MSSTDPHPARKLRDLEVSAVGLGCMGMSSTYGQANDTQVALTLARALERGVTLFDTADMYGKGGNEEVVGRLLAGHRDQVVLATKFGMVLNRVTGTPRGVDGSPGNCRRSVDASLRRMNIDHIDLYYLHRVDPQIPVEETVGAMAELVTAGKVRYLGLSECSAGELRRADSIHPITAVQSEWSVFSRDIESTVLPEIRRLGVGLVAYAPLGRGLLAGAGSQRLSLRDYRRSLPRWKAQNLAVNTELAARIGTLAAGIGATAGQLALAWVLAQGTDVVPIPGTKRASYVDQNVDAATLQIPPEIIDELGKMRPAGARDRTSKVSEARTGK